MDKVPLRVLLVEDDEDDYLLTRDLFNEIPGNKIALDWAKDYDAGLAAVKGCEHDAFLLDYRLGQGDGLTLLRRALALGCRAPIILLTGQDDRDLAFQALEAGAADYLVKGDIDAAVLERSIRYALQQKSHAAELETEVAARTAELKKVNEALREKEQQMRALFETAEAARVSAELAKARAEAATRAKDEFLAALSHELRTPLNPALLLASALVEDETLPPQVSEDIGKIAKGIALQAQLVDDLLDVTRIAQGKLRLNLRPIDSHDALQLAHEILRADIAERDIEVTLDLAAAHHSIEADSVRLQQVFWNVLKNAVKFTPVGGRVKVATRNPPSKPDMLEVEVTDTGVGIEPHMIDRVFDAFAQEEHDRGHRFGGIGLGLAISRQLVELQHGQIRVESAGRGRGATFRIELPLASVGVPPVAPALVSPLAPSLPARRILLVEDHEDTRKTLMQLLERRGHSVTGAATINAARALAASGEYDLVISDLGLPDGDGHQLMSELHRTYGLTGIALSGYGMDDDIARSHSSGFFMHLTKPIDIKVLSAAIAAAPAAGSVAPNGASAVESITR